MSSAFKDQFIKAFEIFEKQLNGEKKQTIHQFRQSSFQSLLDLPLPSKKEESWKYTNLDLLYQEKFTINERSSKLDKASIKPFIIPNLDVYHLTFLNGQMQNELSDLEPLRQVADVVSLSDALKTEEKIIEEYLTIFSQNQKQFFYDLNSAFLQSGVVVRVKVGKVVEKPIHLLFISDNERSFNQPRNFVITGKSSEATIIEQYVSLKEEAAYLTNSVSHFITEENSTLHHYKIQNESEKVYHIGLVHGYQKKDSTFNTHFYSFGAAITRNHVQTELSDENTSTAFNGLFLGSNKQHIDNHTLINHLKPNGTSTEFYKGILTDEASGVFDGKIIVFPNAQKTNSIQSNKNLLLSNDAHVDAKPQLEIYADDVKCFHGATVGQLDEQQLFYLRSRGIGTDLSKAILTHAFAVDVLSHIKNAELRFFLDHLIMRKLNSPIDFK